MINLIRPATVPTSLQDPRIQEHLDKLTDYKANPTLPKPEPPVNYRNSDVLKAFDEFFHSKCYLTEQKFANSWLMDIDHFVPKHERPELRYEWTNLFPVEHNANMMRPRKTPAGGYLDPCSPTEDVEQEIICRVSFGGSNVQFFALNGNNDKARNTVELLNLLHQGRENDEDSKRKVKQLRSLIRKKCEKVVNTVCQWLHAEKVSDKPKALLMQEELKRLLSRKSSFTMIVRSLNVVKQCVPPEFLD